MNTKNTIVVLLLVVVFVGAFIYIKKMNPEVTGEPVVCTMDAKMCPDGSYVGRIAPKCEFAPCKIIEEGTETTLKAKINESVSGLGVTITPLEVLEDSRCPVNAVCVWVGIVRVKATLKSALGTASQTFVLNTPITTEAETVELIDVSPAPHSGTKPPASNYIFTFKVSK